MSAEPGRKAPYSPDLCWCVVWQRAAMELTYWTIARNLSVSLGTICHIWKRFEETGDVAATK